jgi:transcription elongation factor Elf1
MQRHGRVRVSEGGFGLDQDGLARFIGPSSAKLPRMRFLAHAGVMRPGAGHERKDAPASHHRLKSSFHGRSAIGIAGLTESRCLPTGYPAPEDGIYTAAMISTKMADSGHFDARSFISSPYQICRKCGHKTFGILLIRNNHYTRRCRDCGHSGEFRLPELRRKIIYLDQFVVSNLMKLVTPSSKGHERVKADAFWRELYDLLIQLRRLQLIVCPYSESHENESLTFEFGSALKKMYEQLGSGNSFKSFDSIKSQQICELARAWSEEREPGFDFAPSDVLERNPNEWNERFYVTTGSNPFVAADELRRVRNEMHANIARLFTSVWRVEEHDFAHWYHLERKGYQGWLRKAVIQSREERVKALLAHSPCREISLENLNAALPSFAEVLCASLEQIMRFPRGGTERPLEERSKLEKSFGDANRTAEAPFVKLGSLMYAAIAMRAASGQKEPPNSGTTSDIETVSHLMPYCDVMYIDNGCRSLFLDMPKNLRPADADKLFSPNTKVEFLDHLRGIRDAISKEQLEAVREVYGDRMTEGLLARTPT